MVHNHRHIVMFFMIHFPKFGAGTCILHIISELLLHESPSHCSLMVINRHSERWKPIWKCDAAWDIASNWQPFSPTQFCQTLCHIAQVKQFLTLMVKGISLAGILLHLFITSDCELSSCSDIWHSNLLNNLRPQFST